MTDLSFEPTTPVVCQKCNDCTCTTFCFRNFIYIAFLRGQIEKCNIVSEMYDFELKLNVI